MKKKKFLWNVVIFLEAIIFAIFLGSLPAVRDPLREPLIYLSEELIKLFIEISQPIKINPIMFDLLLPVIFPFVFFECAFLAFNWPKGD